MENAYDGVGTAKYLLAVAYGAAINPSGSASLKGGTNVRNMFFLVHF